MLFDKKDSTNFTISSVLDKLIHSESNSIQ